MRNVTGPGDVKPGDIVEHSDHGFRTKLTVCEVVKATKTRLSVRFPGGEIVTAAYQKIVTATVFRRQERRARTIFRLLEPRDIWMHRKPPTPAIDPIFSVEGLRSAIVRPASFDGPEAVASLHAEIDALAAWLAAEPKDPSHA